MNEKKPTSGEVFFGCFMIVVMGAIAVGLIGVVVWVWRSALS